MQPDYEDDFELLDDDRRVFGGYDQSTYDRWLRVGLEGFLLEGKGAWAFGADAAGTIGRFDQLELGLRELYGKLDAEARSLFRQAVANVMQTVTPEERNVPLFEYLLSLASLLPVPEVLPVLPARVGNGFFGLTDRRDGENLFTQTLITVAELGEVAPRKQLKACLLDLIGSAHFDSAYSAYTLLALCRVDAEHFAEHMAQMAEPLNAMFEEFETDMEAQRELAKDLLDRVGLQRLADALSEIIDGERIRYGGVAPNEWLYAALFKGESPLIRPEIAAEKARLYRADKPMVKVTLNRIDSDPPSVRVMGAPSPARKQENWIRELKPDIQPLAQEARQHWETLFSGTSLFEKNSDQTRVVAP